MTLSDVIAIIAIIVSVGSLVAQLIIEYNRNQKNRIRELYNQAYKGMLMKDLPASVLSIVWTKGGIKGTEEFREVCVRLRQQSYFFMFYDEVFYQKVISKIMNIEDFVLVFDNNSYEKDTFNVRMTKLKTMIKELYEFIMDRCLK